MMFSFVLVWRRINYLVSSQMQLKAVIFLWHQLLPVCCVQPHTSLVHREVRIVLYFQECVYCHLPVIINKCIREGAFGSAPTLLHVHCCHGTCLDTISSCNWNLKYAYYCCLSNLHHFSWKKPWITSYYCSLWIPDGWMDVIRALKLEGTILSDIA